MKRIGFDRQAALAKNPSGLGYYVKNLYQALTVISNPPVEIVGLEGRLKRDLSTLERFQHDRWEIDQLARQTAVDVIHQPAFSAPKSKLPVIWTLHDLRQIVTNEAMSLTGSWYWKKYLPYSRRYADVIVCTSENTVRDASRLWQRSASDFRVIPIGVPSEIHTWRYQPTKANQYQQQLGLTGPYFATVGTIQPVKNFSFLVEVFAHLRQEYQLDYQLVIIGKKGWDYDNVAKVIGNHQLTEGKEVIITDYVTDDQKWSLIHDAEAFLFPSLYEGFGIPPLEAQFLGTPIISSNTSSLPDVIGGGGLLVSPTSIKAWLTAYQQLRTDRAKLVNLGQANVARFNWTTIADQWLELYQTIG